MSYQNEVMLATLKLCIEGIKDGSILDLEKPQQWSSLLINRRTGTNLCGATEIYGRPMENDHLG
jgi:hypothetical protein